MLNDFPHQIFYCCVYVHHDLPPLLIQVSSSIFPGQNFNYSYLHLLILAPEIGTVF